MSLVTSPYTIPAAFVATEHVVHPNGLWVVGPERRWNPVNEQQRRYLEIFEIARKEVSAIPEIEAKGSFVAEVLNEFLRVHGFAMELEPFAPDEFAMIATARQLMATRQQARTTQVLFPMVDLDLKVALQWLKGMWTLPQSGPQLKVTQAFRQTKVKMNEEGVRIEEAAAVGIA